MRRTAALFLVCSALGARASGDSTAVRQRFWQGDLLDFSGERARVVVNPLLRVGAGNGCFENIRGARFEAVIDGTWEVRGSLEERQGTAAPLLSEWARALSNRPLQTVVLPEWGRAKWTNPSTDPTLPIAFDASRARVQIGHSGQWGRLRTRFETGLDNRHEGTAEHSLFWSRTAAPLPYVGGALAGNRWHAAAWAGAATGPNRGPGGATAESLFSRQRVTRLGGGFHQGEAFSMDVLWYRLARLSFADEPPAVRHWGGVQAAFRRGPWDAYIALAVDPAAAAYLGEHLHLRWQSPSTRITFAYQRSTPGGYRLMPDRIDLTHSGTPIASPWGDGVTDLSLRCSAHPIPQLQRLACTVHLTHLTQAATPALSLPDMIPHESPKWVVNAFITHPIQPNWPLGLSFGIQGVKWYPATPDTAVRPQPVTWCVGLSHKFNEVPPNFACQIL